MYAWLEALQGLCWGVAALAVTFVAQSMLARLRAPATASARPPRARRAPLRGWDVE